jgi:restriction system protein
MPTPTPFQIDYATIIFKPTLQGFINSAPILINFFVSTWYVWWILLFAAAIKLGYELYQHYQLSKSGIYDVDKMTGGQFEELLEIIFTNLGYKTVRTIPDGTLADYGVDLIIEKDGIRTAVQAKRWKGKVGEDAVREVYSGRNIYDCTETMVVTNSDFTKMAWKLAKSDNVKLWNRKDLIKVLFAGKSKK